MWIFVLCALAIAHVAVAELDCTRDAFEDCETPALFSYVPSDVLEYNRLCPQLPSFLRCLKEFQDECGTNIFSLKEEYEGMHGAFSDLCDEGTFLNTVVTENLKCLNETFRTTSCKEKVKVVTGPFRSPVGADADYTLPIAIMCLQDILESTCIASDIGENCGKDALEATMEFFRRIFYLEETCSHNAEILLKSLDQYKLNPEQKAVVIATLESIILSAKE